MSQTDDIWAIGSAYEPYVGRWSRLVAANFIDWLGAAPSQRWLDVGCGTGVLTRTILARAAPAGVTAIDRSEGFLAYASHAVDDPRAAFRIGDAAALPVDDRAFDVAVAGLVLNFVPDMPKAVAEMARVVVPGGMVAAYVWDYAGEMQLMRRFWDAAVALDPAALAEDEGRRFPVCQPDPLAALFRGGGLAGVEVVPIEVATAFRDFDDYWQPFLGGQGPAPAYCMALTEPQRTALRERLRATLPTAADGSIGLTARAWAVKGFAR
jgi:SAM-dependent methyltransferase